jgi:endonuclease YncB( thermonuclease family)
MRIAGIDTPEINQKCRKSQLEIIDCGILSKLYLKELMEKTPGELVISVVGTDHYGRLLVKVLKGGVNIGEMLVKKGMAFSYKDNYRLEENKAKQEGVGFWSFYEPPIEPYKWRKSNK